MHGKKKKTVEYAFFFFFSPQWFPTHLWVEQLKDF